MKYLIYFENYSNIEIAIGSTVVLQGNKVRLSTLDDNTDNIIGVVRPKNNAIGSSMVGNMPIKWNKKYLTNDYGIYLLDDNNSRILNTEYDNTQKYNIRENRSEWLLIGLLGQMPVSNNQLVSNRWIHMKNISNTVSVWFVK